MRCMVCGAEMILTNVVQDDTMEVAGFDHHTFTCSECQDVEERLVFTKQNRESDTEPMLEQAAPPVAPASTVQDEPVAASGLFELPGGTGSNGVNSSSGTDGAGATNPNSVAGACPNSA